MLWDGGVDGNLWEEDGSLLHPTLIMEFNSTPGRASVSNKSLEIGLFYFCARWKRMKKTRGQRSIVNTLK